MKFEELSLSGEMISQLERHGVTTPTKVQEEVIPAILAGMDLQTQSETGSGKTLGFAVPLTEKLTPGKGVQAIVLAPTRELAKQIAAEFAKFSAHKRLYVLTVYGGVSLDNQVRQVPRTDVVVGTPGRVLDLLRRGALNLGRVKYFVLDEADRMLDMGFIEDIEAIMAHAPKDRQSLLFSATLPYNVLGLSDKYLRNPKHIEVLPEANRELIQYFYNVSKNEKFSLLAHLLKKSPHILSLVFCRTRRTTDWLANSLQTNGIAAKSLNGGMTQAHRERTVAEFKSSKFDVLVATDVAARGLHIEDISHVYNFDLPEELDTYTHRIGRTARLGNKGEAITILSELDYETFKAVLAFYGDSVKELKAGSFPRLSVGPRSYNESGRDGRNGRNRDFRGGNRRDGPRRDFGGPRRDSRGPRRDFGKREKETSWNEYSTNGATRSNTIAFDLPKPRNNFKMR